MSDRYIIPRRLDDPELIGFWTVDEFAGMIKIPFTGDPRDTSLSASPLPLLLVCAPPRPKQAAVGLGNHAAYWHLPAGLTGLKVTPPSHCRLLAG
ncbi:MAG: type IV conjugative transfer system protein TraL [Sphingomonadaceae bacterium]